MSEGQTTAQNQPEGAAQSTDVGVQHKAESILERGDSIVKRIEEGEKRLTEHLARAEQVLARQLLGGRADAGSITTTPQQEQSKKVDELVAKQLGQYFKK